MLPKKRISTHPGEILQHEFLEPLGISQSALARHIGVRHFVVCDLVHAKRNVTPRIAVMLSRALGTSAEFWLGLQADYDVTALSKTAEGKRVAAIAPMHHAG
jgi:addiction module HigA family antidote